MALWIVLAAALGAMLVYLLRRAPAAPAGSSSGNRLSPMADPAALVCACAEWRVRRARYKPEDPRRLCVHLCAWLCADARRIQPSLRPFAAMIARMHEEGRGMPLERPSFAFVLGEKGYLTTMPQAARPWAAVYTEKARYTFHLGEGRWGEDKGPPFADEVGDLIRAEAMRRLRRKGGAA